mmetsp:Transcript_31269/g.61987  ORF Transcript_31269/g.61987 Transcript_31269/m.61987 type:complete len:277 (+) Transcript_31269:60-890(+)
MMPSKSTTLFAACVISSTGAFQTLPPPGILLHRTAPSQPSYRWKTPTIGPHTQFPSNIRHEGPLYFSSADSFDGEGINKNIDSLVYKASTRLRGASWLSWWSQVILTVISSVTFVFARNVMDMQAVSPLEFSRVASKFILPGAGIVTSIMSIIWTWGGRRLSRRFIRRSPSRVESANLLRRVINVGVTLNLIGLFASLLGAQYIVGTLVAKAMQNVVGFGAGSMGGISSQVLQPLDVLVVQANTNILLSHFISLACLLWLTRTVDVLDPPSLDDDE